MNDTFIAQKRTPGKFILLVFLLSTPLWLVGFLTPLQLMPGLPVSSLMVFCPLAVALMLSYSDNQTRGVTELLKRSFSFRQLKQKLWLIPTVLLMPGIAIIAYGFMRLQQIPVPLPEVSVVSILPMFFVFLFAALAEEIGWSGYAIDPLQAKWGALFGSLILGVAWAVWHIIPFIQAGRSITWIIWQCLTLIASRALLVWIYNNTGRSVFAVGLCHTTINVSWQLFPVHGSYYDPQLTGLISIFILVSVSYYWKPNTLSRTKAI